MDDRRQDQRVSGVFEARWQAQSGAASGRLTDLSWHGCFVDVPFPPAIGDEVQVAATIDGLRVELNGRVRHVCPRIGFGMEIDPAFPLTELERAAMRSVLNAEFAPVTARA